MYKEALRIRELWLGHKSLEVAGTLNNLAALLQKQDRLAEAEAMYKYALGMVTKLNPFSNDRIKWSLGLAVLYHKTHKFADASEVMCQCSQIQRSFLESPPSHFFYRIHLFDSRLFAETSFLACKSQLRHDASSFPSAVRQIIDDSQTLLQSPVAVQGTSPYSVTAAGRYLLFKAVEFAHGSDHDEAPRLRVEAHERMAGLMKEQHAPRDLRSAGRHAVAAVQWTAACDAEDLQRRKQLVDDIDADYADS